MKKRIISLLLCACFLFCFGCNEKTKEKSSKKIVTSFYPVYIFTINLTKGIDNVKVENITEEVTGCMHNYQLLPEDMITLDKASLLVVNGSGMETFVDKVSKQLPDLPVVSSSDGIDLLETNASKANHTNGNKVYNAHVWLSVQNAIKQVENISKALQETLPESKDKIEQNKKEYIKRLNELDKQIKTELSDLSDAPVMTFHEAYTYFTNEYGLTVVDTIESQDGQEPSAKEVARLTKEIKDKEVRALFVEPNYEGTSVGVLSKETGVKVYTINPISSGEDKLTGYEDIMLNNVKVIKEALS